MNYKKYLLIFTFIFLIATISAATTTVNLKTMPHKTITITPIATGGGFSALLTPIQGFSGQYGDIKFEFTIEESVFDLNVIIKDGDITLYRTKLLENFVAGTEVNASAAPTDFIFLERPKETILETTEEIITEENITQNESEENLTITISHPNSFKNIITNGYDIIKEKELLLYPLYYFLFGLTALILIFLTVKKNNIKLKLPKLKNKIKLPINEDDYQKAKRELKEAQQKVNELKKKKLEEVEKRIEEDQKELKKLQGKKHKNNFEKKYKENKKKSIEQTKSNKKNDSF